jgi:CHASE2 domain-containing sensor protein
MSQAGPLEQTSRQGFRDFLRGPFLLATAFAIVTILDPLGVEEATAERSEQSAMRIAATLYPEDLAYGPVPADLPDPYENEVVTVVTLDEGYAGTWPPNYRQQGHLLNLIDEFKPAAIFIDLIYDDPHEHPSSTSLKPDDPANLLGALSPGTQTPIYLSGLAPRVVNPKCTPSPLCLLIDQESVLKPIREDPLVRGKGRIVLIEWDGHGDRYPLYVGSNPAAATPAYALYKEWCKGKADCLRESSDEKFSRPMKVLWGAYPPRAQSTFYSFDACQYGFNAGERRHSFLRRAGAFLNQLRLAILGSDYLELTEAENNKSNKDNLLPCPAVNVIPASVFVALEPGSDEYNERLRPLLANRLVLVGADLRGSADTVLSLVHGRIPGVQLHAMALDNLVRYGPSYKRDAPDWVTKYVLPPFVLTLVAWLAFWLPFKLRYEQHFEKWHGALQVASLVLLAGVAAAYAEKGDWIKPMFAIFGGLVLLVIAPTAAIRASLSLLCVIFVALGAIWLGYSPRNWMVLGIAAVLVGEKVYEDFHGHQEKDVVNPRIDRVLKGFADIPAVLGFKKPGRPDQQPIPKKG